MHNFKFVTKARPVLRATVDPVANGRKAVIANLNKQVALAARGETKRTNYYTADGAFFFKLVYGTYNVVGKDAAIEIESIDAVPAIVEDLINAINNGDFDAEIKDISANYAGRRLA